MPDQVLRFFARCGTAHPAGAEIADRDGKSPIARVILLAPFRARRDASLRLALLALELEEVQTEQRSLQLQHDLHEINSEEWHRLVLSLADLQDYAWGLERSIERLREGVAK